MIGRPKMTPRQTECIQTSLQNALVPFGTLFYIPESSANMLNDKEKEKDKVKILLFIVIKLEISCLSTDSVVVVLLLVGIFTQETN